MYKVCFLIVLGIGVLPKVGENLSVRILWAELNRLLTADVESGTDQGTDVFAILIKEISLNLISFSYVLLLLVGVRNIACYTDYKS